MRQREALSLHVAAQKNASNSCKNLFSLFDEKELKREGKTMYIIAHASLQSCGCTKLIVLLERTKNGFSVYEDLWTGSNTHTLLPNKTQKKVGNA